MSSITPGNLFIQTLTHHQPDAQAWVRGGESYPDISGIVNFYRTPYAGVLIEVEMFNLPYERDAANTGFYAMHIHENGDCTPPFNRTGDHYNPTNAAHPQHAGDMPPLLSNQGYAWMSFYDKRFQLQDIVGKSIVVHSDRDDFTSQPSGDAGSKIACGEIREVREGR